MNSVEKQREQKKEQIFDAVTSLITTLNFKEIGIRKIAKHAGVSPFTIYNYFGSKEELLKQVLSRKLEKIKINFNNKMDINAPFKEKINILHQTFFDNLNIINSEGIYNFIIDDPTMKGHFEEYIQQTCNSLLVKIIEQAKTEGELKDTVSTTSIKMFIYSISTLISNLSISQRMDNELHNELKDLLFYGLLGKVNKKRQF